MGEQIVECWFYWDRCQSAAFSFFLAVQPADCLSQGQKTQVSDIEIGARFYLIWWCIPRLFEGPWYSRFKHSVGADKGLIVFPLACFVIMQNFRFNSPALQVFFQDFSYSCFHSLTHSAMCWWRWNRDCWQDSSWCFPLTNAFLLIRNIPCSWVQAKLLCSWILWISKIFFSY